MLACAAPSAPGPRSTPAAQRPAAFAGAPPPPAAPQPTETGLSFAVEPPDAEVFVDGRSHGRVADLARSGLPLPPGLYQVSLKRAGFATWRAEVAVRAGLEPIRVTLSRAAP